jgi:hypothetical protein
MHFLNCLFARIKDWLRSYSNHDAIADSPTASEDTRQRCDFQSNAINPRACIIPALVLVLGFEDEEGWTSQPAALTG